MLSDHPLLILEPSVLQKRPARGKRAQTSILWIRLARFGVESGPYIPLCSPAVNLEGVGILKLAKEALRIHQSVDVGRADNLESFSCLGLAALRSEDHGMIRAEEDAYHIA